MILPDPIRRPRLLKHSTHYPERSSSEASRPWGQERPRAMLRPPTGCSGPDIPIVYEPAEAVWDCFGDPSGNYHCLHR